MTATKKDMNAIWSALNHAWDERQSYAEAVEDSDPDIAKKALAKCKEYERVAKKIFDQELAGPRMAREAKATPSITLWETSAQHSKKDT